MLHSGLNSKFILRKLFAHRRLISIYNMTTTNKNKFKNIFKNKSSFRILWNSYLQILKTKLRFFTWLIEVKLFSIVSSFLVHLWLVALQLSILTYIHLAIYNHFVYEKTIFYNRSFVFPTLSRNFLLENLYILYMIY